MSPERAVSTGDHPLVIQLVGERFGRLVVVERVGSDRGGRATWRCRCDCGRDAVVRGNELRAGRAVSCGCVMRAKRALIGERTFRHGAARGGRVTPEYQAWRGMLDRCENPRSRQYANYGGRGIRVCDAWRTDFAAFVAHVGPRPSRLHSLDRIDVNGRYEPGNVRWATQTTQQRNRRNNRLITWRGETRCVAGWAEARGLSVAVLWRRLESGWSVERALSTPLLDRYRH